MLRSMIHYYQAPHSSKKKFYNHHQEQLHSFFLHSCALFFRSRYRLFKRKNESIVDWIEPNNQPTAQAGLTWIGHSTFLIEYNGIRILTDPIFGNASFLFKRIAPPGIALQQLPKIDMILLSHNHRDHMDAWSLLQLRHHNPRILVPSGDKAWFDRRGFDTVKESVWWDQQRYIINNQPVTITFLPAHHWSQRSLFDRNRSLWGSWLIQFDDGYTIYFAGDTAYASHFAAIKERFPAIDVALLPIGPCEPHHTMKFSHMNARQACRAFFDLRARMFIPMHWGTFYFGLDSFEQPIYQLMRSWHEYLLPPKQLQILKFGQQWNFNKNMQLAQLQFY